MRDLDQFRTEVEYYYEQVNETQANLARAINRDPSDLNKRLRGKKGAILTSNDVRNIVKVLARWRAITYIDQARFLLSLMSCDFNRADWGLPPLNKLVNNLDDAGRSRDAIRQKQILSARTLQYRPPFEETRLEPPESFVGRNEDLQWLRERLIAGGMTGISALGGMGGIGKTALAGEAVRQLRKEGYFQDGIVVERCLGKTNAIEIVQEVLRRFDPERRRPETSNVSELIDVVHRLLDEKKNALIVLDNIEPELNVMQVITILRAASTTLLLTARQVLPVSPMGSRVLSLLSLEEALDLFAQYNGKQTAKDFNTNEFIASKEIVEILDKHTLAVKVTGAYAHGRSLQKLVEELKNQQRALELPDKETPRAVAQSFALSTDKLSDEELRFFAALAAFATTGFGRQAALALCTALHLTGSDQDVLDKLIQRALVEPSLQDNLPEHSDHERLRLHPLMRRFAASKFMRWQQSERNIAYRAIAEYYVQYTAQYPRKISLEALNIDDNNIKGALDWALSEKEDELVAVLCSHMYAFWRNTGRTNEGLHYLPEGERAASVVSKATNKGADHLREAELAVAYGQALRRIGALADTEQAFKKSLDIFREIQDIYREGIVLGYLGRVAQSRGQLDKAERYCQDALKIHRNVGDRLEESVDLSSLGEIFQTRGQYEEATSYLEEALTIQQEVEHQLGEGISLCFLGINAQALEQFDKARDYFMQTLHLTRTIRSRVYEGIAHRELGYLAHVLGQLDEADQHYQEALQIANETLDRQSEIVLWSRLAALFADRDNDLKRADEFYRKSIDMGMKYQYIPRAADALMMYGCFLIERPGNQEEGCAQLLKALQLNIAMGPFREEEARKKIQQLGCNQGKETGIDKKMKSQERKGTEEL